MATACECVRKRLKYRERKCVHVAWYVLDSPSKRAQDCIHLCLPYLIMNQKAFSLQLSFGTWQCGSLVYTFRTLLCGMSLMCYMYTLPLICAYLSLSLSLHPESGSSFKIENAISSNFYLYSTIPFYCHYRLESRNWKTYTTGFEAFLAHEEKINTVRQQQRRK